MPMYLFKCYSCNFAKEQYFMFSEEHILTCENCEGNMSKVIQATPAIFRGGGWGGQ